MPTNDIDVSENDNDDDETMVDDHMVQMVNDVYQCFNEHLDVNCENSQATSMEEMNDINQYKKLIDDAKTPLYPGCTSFTKLSATVQLYNLKVKNGWSDTSFTQMLKLKREMLPKENTLPDSSYAAKRLIKSLGLDYEMIHACQNDCILYRGKYESTDKCPTCGKSRWKVDAHSGKVRKGVPSKVLRYFPIVPRLKRMYRYDFELFYF